MKKLFWVFATMCIAGAAAPQSGVVINGVTWATRNVGEPGTFVAHPEDFGNYYKHREICPSGWRLPTQQEAQSLVSSPNRWTTVNGVAGMQYGGDGNTIFLPAAGRERVKKRKSDLYVGTHGFYWTSTKVGLSSAHDLLFYEGFSGHPAGGVIQRKKA